jgi:predicted transcriptional regulator
MGNEINNGIHVRLYRSIVTSGLSAKLGADAFFALIHIAMYMDAEGKAYPTFETLAKDMGVGLSTAKRYVKKLLEVKWNGQPLVTVSKNSKKVGFDNNVYHIHPIAQIAIMEGKVQDIDVEELDVEEWGEPVEQDVEDTVQVSITDRIADQADTNDKDTVVELEERELPVETTVELTTVTEEESVEEPVSHADLAKAQQILDVACTVFNGRYRTLIKPLQSDVETIARSGLLGYDTKYIRKAIILAVSEYDRNTGGWGRPQFIETVTVDALKFMERAIDEVNSIEELIRV